MAESEKPTTEELIDAMLELTEENRKMRTILKAHGLLSMHLESRTPVV